MNIVQLESNPVDITTWRGEEESRIFPVGTREKKLVYCPQVSPYDFLEAGHRYLFKLSVKKCPEQFWIEIFAYRLGSKMGIEVPPAFAAYDEKEGQCGALMRWFLEEIKSDISSPKSEESSSGGDLLQGYIPGFDQKKGLQHNFETVSKIFEDKYNQIPWKHYWAKTFLFDALLGNVDRHQDNWGIIDGFSGEARITPVFDNGTSMGHEIKADRFHLFDSHDQLIKYVCRGAHHMKWQLKDEARVQHGEFLKRYVNQYPETRSTMLECLGKIDSNSIHQILDEMTKFDIPVRFTGERAGFMLRLIKFRYERLLKELGY